MAKPTPEQTGQPERPGQRMVHAIWQVQEIVDHILLQLPIMDMVRTRRVCSRWKNSRDAQRAMFLLPFSDLRIEEDSVDWSITASSHQPNVGLRLTSKPVINPVINEFLFEDGFAEGSGFDLQHYGLVAPVTIRFDKGIDFMRPRELWNTVKEFQDRPHTRREEFWHRKHALWKKMLVTQPPATELYFMCVRESYDWGSEYEETEEHQRLRASDSRLTLIQDKNGVKLGQLVKALQDHWHVCPMCPWYAEEFGPSQDQWHICNEVEKMEDDVSGEEILHRARSVRPLQQQQGSGQGEQSTADASMSASRDAS